MTRITIKHLVVEELGYCCEWAFFSLFRQTTKISERLGVSRQAIKKRKALRREGCIKCEGKPNCLRHNPDIPPWKWRRL